MTTLWLLGAGGLLGRAAARAARARGRTVVAPSIPWHDPDRAAEVFAQTVATLPEGDLQVAWCAGVGVVGSAADLFDGEALVVEALLDALATLPAAQLAHTTVFAASSAGAVYAGSRDAPYHEFSPTQALVPYGHAKLRLERQFTDFAHSTGARVVLGRIANLYGPGQDLSKGQGLVSVLLSGALTGNPVTIYVDLDTVRDYVYVDDAAAVLLACLDRAAATEPGSTTVKVIASRHRTTVSHLVEVTRRIASQRPLLVLGASPNRRGQARDLSLRSRVWTDLDALASTPLLVGAHRTYLDLQRARLEARL